MIPLSDALLSDEELEKVRKERWDEYGKHIFQSRVHTKDIQGHIMGHNDDDWPKLILPVKDKE